MTTFQERSPCKGNLIGNDDRVLRAVDDVIHSISQQDGIPDVLESFVILITSAPENRAGACLSDGGFVGDIEIVGDGP